MEKLLQRKRNQNHTDQSGPKKEGNLQGNNEDVLGKQDKTLRNIKITCLFFSDFDNNNNNNLIQTVIEPRNNLLKFSIKGIKTIIFEIEQYFAKSI